MTLSALQSDLQSQVEHLNVRIAVIEWTIMDKDRVLQVCIEHPEGVDLELCVKVSDLIAPTIDECLVEEEQFILEVTSLGAEQPFGTTEEMAASIDQYVYVEFIEPIQQMMAVQGNLIEYQSDYIVVEYREKTRHKKLEIAHNNIKSARRAVKI